MHACHEVILLTKSTLLQFVKEDQEKPRHSKICKKLYLGSHQMHSTSFVVHK